MNKIYRRLWSTARQCWVVASELTSPRGKASQTVGSALLAVSLLTSSAAAIAAEQSEDDAVAIEDSQLLWAMQAVFGARSMSVSSSAPPVGTLDTVIEQFVLTSDSAYRNSTIRGNNLVVVGSRSSLSGSQSVAYGNMITSTGNNNTAIGHNVQITGGGYATGVGAAAVANGMGTTALGNNAKANTENSIAVGSGSRTDSGAGISKIAIGGNAYAGTGGWTGAIALGGAARAEYDSVAIGYEAKTNAAMSVALGRGSIATEYGTVSVGSAGKERRIVNVKDGAINGTSTDAVNGRQLNSARDLAQRGVNDAATAQRVATGAKSTADQALANTKLVTQTSAASGIRIGGENTGNVLTVSNRNGDLRYLNGVRNGTLSATSTDAVTGQQLFATNNQLAAAVARFEAEAPALGRAAAAEGVGADAGTAVGNASKAYNNRSLALGADARAGVDAAGNKLATAHGAVALGGGTRSGESSTAAGNGAQAVGKQAVAVGAQAKATGLLSTAMGYNAQATTGHATAIGRETVASGAYSTALGNLSKATAESAVALGDRAEASHNRSVALGRQSVTTANDQVSVGNASINLKRRIVNVQDGALSAGSSEVVTGNQLFATNTTLGTVQTTANQAKATADLGLSKAEWLGRLISGGPTGGVQIGAENAGSLLSVRNQTGGRRVITGLHNADLSTASTEAVTGQQLFATNNNVATAQLAADTALGKVNNLGGLVSQAAGNGNVRLGGENTGAVLDVRNKSNANRTLSGLKEGSLDTTSTEAVTGKQLNTTNTEVASVRTVATAAQTTANTAKTTADNALGKANTLGGLVSQTTADSNVRLGGENTGSVLDVRNKSGAGRSLTGLADGAISATSTEAVTGKQLQATHDRLATAQSRADAAHAGATTAQATADQAKAKADATGNAVATAGAIDFDKRATASGNLAMAMGQAAKANGTAAFAMGHSAIAAGDNAVSVGSASSASARAAVALGGNAKAKHENSVALGERSETGGTNEVSVGNAATGLKRRVVNVDDARLTDSSTDAVTGKQLFATNEKVQTNEGLLAAHGTDLAAQSGRIADNRRDLDALRSEFEDFDPDLDGVVKFAADGSVDIAGGRVRGVAAGDISSATSTDAVNGGQLFATNERISAMEDGGRFVKIGSDGLSDAAKASKFSVAIGDSAEAGNDLNNAATAVGMFARAIGAGSVALGSGAFVDGAAEEGFALGAGANVMSARSAAIGGSAKVSAGSEYSVALGSGSIADQAFVVSVGSEGLKRRIVNVARGTAEHDVATIGQLNESTRALGGGAGLDANGNIIAPTYNVQGGTQNNVGDALAALDSAVVTADSRVDNLEGKLRSAFQDGPSVRADGLNQLVLAGANGSVLTNLADGRIAAGSRDAVNGSQLFEAKQEIARNRNDLNDLRGERDGLLSRGLMAAEQGNVIDYGGARLTGVADGVISAESRDVVNGRQLFEFDGRLMEIESQRRFFKIGTDEYSEGAYAGLIGVAIGESAEASPLGEGGVAVGGFARALGTNSVALGRGSQVIQTATNGFALGASSRVDAEGGLAVGANSRVLAGAKGSIALGESSIADVSGTVSVGGEGLQRRIVNVANGRNATDAATVGQLRGALATLGGDVDANGNIINPTFNVQGGQQSTLNEALSSLDSAVVTNTTRTDRVESQLRAVFQDSPTVRNDGLNQLTFAGANGMVLSNVANGAIAAGSRDAVNGGQLHSMQQQLNGRMDGLEQRIDGQPQAPQSRALTVAAVDSATSSAPVATPAADEPAAPPPSSGDNKVVADAGNAPKSSPQPQADAPKPDSPKPQVDTAELEKMLARANEYSDGISREVDARLNKMDKRFNRMAAMSSAQSAMAMNTAGLNTYNRLGAGVGYSEGESAMAVGYQRVLNDKGSATFSLNGAFTNSGERSMGVGVGIGW